MTKVLVAIAAALAGTSCYTMRSVTLEDLSAARVSRIWVTQPDQSIVILDDAQMFRGKLAGFEAGKYRELPPDALGQMRVRKLAAGRTVSLIAAGAAVFTVAAVLMSGGEDHFDPCAGDEDCVEMLRTSP
jgi:hypothetical protein